MKSFRKQVYQNICSILASDDKNFKSAQNAVLFSRAISTFPSKNIYCLTASRLLHFYEKNILNPDLIIDVMREEGEDEEIINTVIQLREHPTITMQHEVTKLCQVLADHIKYSKVLKLKEPYMQALDLINDDDESNVKQTVETLYRLSNEIQTAYNSVNISETQHTFDPRDPDGMKSVLASTKDMKNSNKILVTGIRLLNTLLSPGYMSGCVYIYAACPGCYKSGILLESFVDACKFNAHIKETIPGKKPVVLYITMENTMQQTVRRLWSILFPSADLSMFSVDEAYEMIINELTPTGFVPIIMYYGYREKSTADIANIIRSLNNDEYHVVALFFDYIKRIRPARTDTAATASEKSELNAVMNEFKVMASEFDIPIISAHQLNRQAAAEIDAITAKGGYNKTDQAMTRSGISVAWEVIEVADWLTMLNIENNGEQKVLLFKTVKQRDKQSANPEDDIIGFRHPFLSSQSFSLKLDIMENCSLSTPLYIGRQSNNFMANV